MVLLGKRFYLLFAGIPLVFSNQAISFVQNPMPPAFAEFFFWELRQPELSMTTPSANLDPESKDAPDPKKNSLKVRAAVFFTEGKTTRSLYGNFWPEYSAEYNRYFRHHWSFFLNTAFYIKHGHSISRGGCHFDDKTKVFLIPVTIGVNAQIGGSSWWHPYLGVGAGAVYGQWHDRASCVQQKVQRWGFASFYQAGMEFDIGKYVFFDLFGSYRLNWFHFNSERSQTQTGGWQVGGGIGARF